jgi:hypothetical protein
VEDGDLVTDDGRLSLETALAATELDADAALKAAAAAVAAVKRVRTAAHVGNLRDLLPAITAAEEALARLEQRLAATRAGWDFDEETYFGSGQFQRELLETAAQMNVRIYEQDERLYAYPALVRVLPDERMVTIDRARERRLRPKVLAAHLQDLQRRPPRFKPEAFLNTLHSAWQAVTARGDGPRDGRVAKLLDVYALLTLLPGAQRDYSRQEFARDIYLLDQSGETHTRSGATLSFPASSGTRSAAGTLRVVTERGEEKVYYGITFQAG